ncbi:MAG: hypothetical protein ACXW2E_00225 [Nitrososphaeraceae archaeon]
MDNIWVDIKQGLPVTPTPPNHNPIPEILRVIEYCLDDNIEQYQTAMKLVELLSPLRDDIEFLNWKAMVEHDAKAYAQSLNTSEQILTHIISVGALYNAGRVAYKANYLEKSKYYLEEALKMEPTNSSILLDLSVTVCTMGHFDEAFNIINNIDINTLDDHHKKIVDFNKGWHFIRNNSFKQGIEFLHLGREINIWGSDSRKYKKPRWDGVTREDSTILIVGEGGIGDEIINARFSKIIQDRGMKCVMSTCHNNISMLKSIRTIDDVFNNSDIDIKEWDYWIPCMDLPYILRIESNEIPSLPYLTPNNTYVQKWKNKISSNKKLKVGIRWMGNPKYELELHRTIPITYFEQLSNKNISFFSLQKNDGFAEMCLPIGVIDISDDLTSWDDTMAAIMNLDLVITSCTSIAHVSAALGKETWIVVPLLPYYTWADMKKQSYWYDSVSVYRQTQWRNWEHPFKEIKQDLLTKLEKS